MCSSDLPIKVDVHYADRDRAFLMGSDPDPFARWEAGQQYGTKALLGMIEALQKGGSVKPDAALSEAIGKTLRDERLERAFVAMAILLPPERYLAEQMQVVDVDAIATARDTMRRAIAQTLKSDLLAVYHRNRTNEPFSPDAEQAGRRALKNTALGYLGVLETPDTLELVTEQFRTSDNMTDTIAALGVLNDLDVKARSEALDAFYARFKDDALVVEKWLSLQAMSRLPNTLDTVRALLKHPAFSMKNPNKVRSLLGAFAGGNQQRFHAASGEGYDFIAEQTIHLDKINPHEIGRAHV